MEKRSYPHVLFGKTFPCDGFNAIDEVHDADYLAYMDHPLTMAMSFLGIPNRPLSANKKQSVKNILKNILYSPVSFIFFPLRLAGNIVKVITEFLPFLAAHNLKEIANNATYNQFKRGLALAGSLIFNVIGVLGRCITSPVKSMRVALQVGERLHGSYSTKAKVVGGLLAALSLAVTVTAYVFLFPFVAHLAAPYVAAFANAYLPTVVLNAFAVIQPHLTILGVAIEALMGVSLTPVATGIAAIIGFTAATIGTAANRLIDKVTNWFFHGHESIQKAQNAKLDNAIQEGYESTDRPEVKSKKVVIIDDYLNKKDIKSSPQFFKPVDPVNNAVPSIEVASQLTPRLGSTD